MSKPQAAGAANNVISINTDVCCILCGSGGAIKDAFCMECVTASINLKVPPPHEFSSERGRKLDFLLAPELARIGRHLIRHYAQDFASIQDAEIDYFWKEKGGGAGGKNTLGKIKKVTGELKYYSEKDYLVWVAADHCFHFNYFKFTALVFHELKHGWYNPGSGNYEVVGYDFEGFGREVEVFGEWKSDIAMIGAAFRKITQPKLFK